MKIYKIQESLWQSIVADCFTFGLLGWSIWFSGDSRFWNFICFAMFFLFLLSKSGISKSLTVFDSEKKLLEYLIDKYEQEQKKGVGN